MRLGLSSAAFYGRMETEACAAHLAELPLDVCEIFLETFSEYSAAFGGLVRHQLQGLPCVSVHPLGSRFEPELFGQSQRQVEDALHIFENVCISGEALGARYYVMHGKYSVRSHIPPDKIHRLQPTMARMQAIAASHGMEVLWENVSWCSVRTPEDVRAVRQLLPDMRFVLDTKQANEAGCTPCEMAEAMAGRIAHVHVLDWKADGTKCLPGEGVVDWSALMKCLRKVGFDGAVILEPYAEQSRDEKKLLDSLSALRSAMA